MTFTTFHCYLLPPIRIFTQATLGDVDLPLLFLLCDRFASNSLPLTWMVCCEVSTIHLRRHDRRVHKGHILASPCPHGLNRTLTRGRGIRRSFVDLHNVLVTHRISCNDFYGRRDRLEKIGTESVGRRDEQEPPLRELRLPSRRRARGSSRK